MDKKMIVLCIFLIVLGCILNPDKKYVIEQITAFGSLIAIILFMDWIRKKVLSDG